MKKNSVKTVILVVFILGAAFSAFDLHEVRATEPTVQTLSPTDITQTSAKLRAAVNPKGLPTTVDFCSCDFTSSPSFFTCKSAATQTGTLTREVSVTLSGLQAGRTYKYVAQARNADGNSSGLCVSFTTLAGSTPKRPKVQTLSPANITSMGAILRASVNPEGAPTTLHFVYQKVGGSSNVTPGQNVGAETSSKTMTYNLTGLKPSTEYRYRAWAQNSAGETDGDWVTFHTLAETSPTTPPATSAPAQGTLTIASNIGGFMLFINGGYAVTDNGDGIATINLSPGTYNIALQKTGCFPASDTATVTGGSNTTINITMTCTTPQTTAPPSQTLPPETMSPTSAPATSAPTGETTATNNPPHANAGGGQNVYVGDIATFNGTASYDPDGNVLTYIWNFGDGQTGSGVSPMHTYGKSGNYAVSLTVSDGQYQDTAYVQVTVNEKPGGGFSLGGNTMLYIGMGVIALLLLILIVVMLVRK